MIARREKRTKTVAATAREALVDMAMGDKGKQRLVWTGCN
jgi:hypothetical protein